MNLTDKDLWNKTPNELTVVESLKIQLVILAALAAAPVVVVGAVSAAQIVKEKYQKAKQNRQILKAQLKK